MLCKIICLRTDAFGMAAGFSNQPYFLSDTLGLLRKEQSTAEVGLVWFGAKQGAW